MCKLSWKYAKRIQKQKAEVDRKIGNELINEV